MYADVNILAGVGGELPCPRTAGEAGVPTNYHPSRRRTSSAWIM